MKTFYGISLFLLCFIVSYGDAFAAVDVTIKTSLMRTITQTIITGASSGSCGNAAPEPDTLNFEIKVVDSVTTQFTVRVVEKENTSVEVLSPSTHAINFGMGGNYNRANGELTHTVTGIPSSKKPLLLQLFKGGSASGTPYVEQEVSSARGTKVQSGVLTIGDIGNFDNSLGSAGGVVTGGSKSSDGSSSEITVNIETQEDANYVVMVTIDSQTNGSRQENSQIRTPVVYDKQSSSFKVYLNDPIGSTQNIRLNVMIQGYQ
ncbi:MAG: hypothetical protein ACK6BZ_13050 [Candidatus Kapaibacterium sp.]